MAVTRPGQWSMAGRVLSIILCVVLPLHLIPLMAARYRKWMRVYLREYLNTHEIPICRKCGYNLRGKFKLAVRNAERSPIATPWLTRVDGRSRESIAA
jgi:hypothetical protein